MPDLTDAEFLDEMSEVLKAGESVTDSEAERILSLARRAAERPCAVRVKPLEWKWDKGEEAWSARAIAWLSYYVEPIGDGALLRGPLGSDPRNRKFFSFLDAAKSAAQAHYRSLLLACVETIEVPEDVRETARTYAFNSRFSAILRATKIMADFIQIQSLTAKE